MQTSLIISNYEHTFIVMFTGTLTENDMIFRKCAVGHRRFADVNNRLFEILDGGATHHVQVDLSEV